MIRTAIALGCPALAVYRAASLSAAEAFGLKDRGLIAPGKRADIAVIWTVWKGATPRLCCAVGVVADDASYAARETTRPVGRQSVRAERLVAADFRTTGNRVETPVIGILPGKIITEHLTCEIAPHGWRQAARSCPRPGEDRRDRAAWRERQPGHRFREGVRSGAGRHRVDRLPRSPQHRGRGCRLRRHGAGRQPSGARSRAVSSSSRAAGCLRSLLCPLPA